MKSRIWNMCTEEFKKLVYSCSSFSEILQHFGLKNIGGNFHTLKRRLIIEDISYQHMKFKRHRAILPKIGDDKIFIENSKVSRKTVKRRLIINRLIPYKCKECNLNPMWNNKPLTLRLDHINGIRDDNRIENLRFVCPNCDSQSDTYGGRNIDWGEPIRYYCSRCGNRTHTNSCLCVKCKGINSRKVNRPSKEELSAMVWSKPTTTIASEFGVSDKAISKWCKKYGISKPGVGYWQNQPY